MMAHLDELIKNFEKYSAFTYSGLAKSRKEFFLLLQSLRNELPNLYKKFLEERCKYSPTHLEGIPISIDNTEKAFNIDPESPIHSIDVVTLALNKIESSLKNLFEFEHPLYLTQFIELIDYNSPCLLSKIKKACEYADLLKITRGNFILENLIITYRNSLKIPADDTPEKRVAFFKDYLPLPIKIGDNIQLLTLSIINDALEKPAQPTYSGGSYLPSQPLPRKRSTETAELGNPLPDKKKRTQPIK